MLLMHPDCYASFLLAILSNIFITPIGPNYITFVRPTNPQDQGTWMEISPPSTPGCQLPPPTNQHPFLFPQMSYLMNPNA